MPRKPSLTPWQELEQQAYHAYREWPLFLKLRLRQLRRQMPPQMLRQMPPHTAESDAVEAADEVTTAEDITLLQAYGLLLPEGSANDG